ncbi:MAG TPA: hypothetical protein VNN73_20930 [Blastocatellia bacterium]|jgi:hypothetical protein|nr:hypothetical protein [Blastocatellia bacterium]
MLSLCAPQGKRRDARASSCTARRQRAAQVLVTNPPPQTFLKQAMLIATNLQNQIEGETL